MKNIINGVLFACLVTLFTACGGGGGGTSERFTVSTSTGANGSISPTSVTLNENDDTTFTVNPDTGYSINTITGCGGSLTGNSYTTGQITADCTVTVDFIVTPITSFELIDPTPGINDQFGSEVVLLGNGNIVVTDPFDSSVAVSNGAVHLYNPITQTVIASFYGDNADDQLGSGGITALANSNFVISSPQDSVGGVINAGSVQLVNGETGIPIGTKLNGGFDNDRLGSGGIAALANSRFVIISPEDDVNSIADAGSVQLVSTTGIVMGTPLAGNNIGDRLGSDGVTALTNNNYVVASSTDNIGGIGNAGSVRLVDANGIPMGTPLVGDNTDDQLGSGGITALANGNYVIASPLDDFDIIIDVVVDAGSVHLFDGDDGTPIGDPVIGNFNEDQMGIGGVTALANSNFVVTSYLDNVGGTLNAGSVILKNGTNGDLIDGIEGTINEDQVGRGGVTALINNASFNFVVVSHFEDIGVNQDAGSVRLVNGVNGVTIGTPLVGDNVSDMLGSGGITALANGNYVIASPGDDDADTGNGDAGSVRLVNADTGQEINIEFGDIANKQLGVGAVTVLANGNFVLSNHLEDINSIVDVGSVQLFDGSLGTPIGTPLTGNSSGDALSFDGVTALPNSNYIVASRHENIGGITNAGSVRLFDGTSGAQSVGALIAGSAFFDFSSVTIVPSDTGGFYIIAGCPT